MLVLGILAFIFHDSFLHFVLDQFRDLNVIVQTSGLNDVFTLKATFVGVISLIPALLFFSHFILKDQNPKIFLFILPMTLLCGFALMALHLFSIRTEIVAYPDLSLLNIQNSFSISNIHAERYLGIGFILGTLFSTAILSFSSRDRKS
jgi:hypothetical protein